MLVSYVDDQTPDMFICPKELIFDALDIFTFGPEVCGTDGEGEKHS